MNAGKFIGFDPLTRTVATRNISYGDHYLNMKHGKKNPNFSQIKNRDGVNNTETYDANCVASDCMMWVWDCAPGKDNTFHVGGHCGMVKS